MNVLAQIVVAASYGVDKLRADGIRVDRDQFDQALRLLAALSRLIDPPLARVDEVRKLGDDGEMVMNSAIVAARHRVTRSAVTDAARAGRLRGVRGDDGKWKFTAADVDKWRPRGT